MNKKRLRVIGFAFIILGCVFANTALHYIQTRGNTPAYIMMGASVMMILSGIFRVWRSSRDV